ncbi:MAG: aldo/keto reductase [Acidimicrobiales bacterium]|jgi:aryl-alcohol dehydrogenase-like predicted oxidoreductase|nr:aldo/keto reductase [Acidimicrobiales bacterium]
MRYVEVNGVPLSAIGLGCWQFGSRDWGYGKSYGDTTAVELVHRSLDLGVNLVDTAEVYARGVSEAIVGRALEGRRDEAFVATKLLPIRPTAPVTEEHGRLSSMRLGIDAIDLYQVHWPNPLFPLSGTMDGMRRLLDAGVVRHVGVSNFPAPRWAAAERLLGRPVLSNQVQFSLLYRKPDRENVPHAVANDRVVIAYSPLAQGLLGGRYDADHLPPGPARRNNPLCLPENVRRATPVIDAVRRIAAAHDATPAQVALAWLIARPNVVAIPGASSVEQLEHNVAAADLDLDVDELAELTAESDRFRPVGLRDTARGMLQARRRAV